MNIALIGKWSNAWGAEFMVKRGFEALGHVVTPYALADDALRVVQAPTDLTVAMQGYGLSPEAIDMWRHTTGKPVVCWHGEVLSPEWPTTDPVVQNKATQLSRNVAAYDLVLHNCTCCLRTVKALGGRRVAWCPVNGVDPSVHRRLDIPKRYDVGTYGWPSDRRINWLRALQDEGIEIAYPHPRDGVYGDALTQFINECRVIVNIHFSQSKNVECRVYEALGCGVPVVSEPISMPDLFPTGKGVVYADTPHDMAATIRLLLADKGAEAAQQGQRGYALVHARYTYRQRCALLLETVAKDRP